MDTDKLMEKATDFGRDIKLNLSSVLSEEGAPGLSQKQILAVALSCAYSTKYEKLISELQDSSKSNLPVEYIEAAKAASAIMAMNNVYYRFLHLAEDKEFSKMPARLRMNVIGKPGIEKVDFELMCLAVSAIAGCGSCITAHINEARKAGLSSEGIQSVVRIASVINAAAQTTYIAGLG